MYVGFDIRIAGCGIPVICHDEYAPDGSGQTGNPREHPFPEFAEPGRKIWRCAILLSNITTEV